MAVIISDIDECTEWSDTCPAEGQTCVNDYGSYHCGCSDGFREVSSLAEVLTCEGECFEKFVLNGFNLHGIESACQVKQTNRNNVLFRISLRFV